MALSKLPTSQSGSADAANKPEESVDTNAPGGSLAQALAQLNQALDGLDNIVEANVEERLNSKNADQQVQRMADDRAKLAKQLDTTEARAGHFKDVNSEVSRRLVNAMEMVRGVLDKQT